MFWKKWATSSKKVPSNMRRLRPYCAWYHLGLCSPFIHSVVSNDSVSRQWRSWSECADAQANLGLCCSHMFEDRFWMVQPKHCNNPKYWDILSTYHISPKIWNSPLYYLLMCQKYCCMYDKQFWSWSDAAFCSIWSGSTLFARAYLSQYLALLW